MDRIDEGYQWLEGIADRMKEEIGGGVAASPESLKVRELLWQFGFQRRGDWINKHIRKLMRKFKLRADQDFTTTGLDSRITITIDSEARGAPRPPLPAEPTHRIGTLKAARRSLASVKPQITPGQLKAAAEDSQIIEGPADLTFGGHCRLLENRDNWEQLTLNVDRKVFVKCLHSVREIRNDVMHFNPDGLDEG